MKLSEIHQANNREKDDCSARLFTKKNLRMKEHDVTCWEEIATRLHDMETLESESIQLRRSMLVGTWKASGPTDDETKREP